MMHGILQKALDQAVSDGLTPRNAAKGIKLPQGKKKEIRPLSPDEARVLLDAARGDRLEALYVLAVSTGLREGEPLPGFRMRVPDDRMLRAHPSLLLASPPHSRTSSLFLLVLSSRTTSAAYAPDDRRRITPMQYLLQFFRTSLVPVLPRDQGFAWPGKALPHGANR